MCTHTTKIQGQTVFLVLLTAPVPFACIQFAFLELHTGSENERQNKGRGERVQPAHFSVFFFLGGNAALEFSARFTLLASRASAPHHAQPTPPPAKFCSYCCFSALIVLRWCAADAGCADEAETQTDRRDVFLCEYVCVDWCMSSEHENERGCCLH